jgi:magnesium-protoporphyrin O-methyltransferase
MRGLRLLDAGCGTGALAQAAMQRGAQVVAIDLSPTLVDLARQRHEQERQTNPSLNAQGGRIEFLAGDMLSPEHGWFDHVVCMDSLIHYDTPDIARAFETLAQRTRHSVLFTFAPHTPLLATAHALGRWFPRSDRSPQLSPVRQSALHQHIVQAVQGQGWQPQRMQRIASGFYTSQAWEWVKP